MFSDVNDHSVLWLAVDTDLQRQVATSLSFKSISGCVRTACSQLFEKYGTS